MRAGLTMRVLMRVQTLLVLFAFLAALIHGLQLGHLGRRGAVLGACAATVLRPNAPARADGGKSDKKFQECLSKCVYEETKITKGIAKVEVVSRSEAYAICKPKCATSKEQVRRDLGCIFGTSLYADISLACCACRTQLLIGQPKK